jgi:hypothetical protein
MVSQQTRIEPTETSTEKGKRSLVNCFLKNSSLMAYGLNLVQASLVH